MPSKIEQTGIFVATSLIREVATMSSCVLSPWVFQSSDCVRIIYR